MVAKEADQVVREMERGGEQIPEGVVNWLNDRIIFG